VAGWFTNALGYRRANLVYRMVVFLGIAATKNTMLCKYSKTLGWLIEFKVGVYVLMKFVAVSFMFLASFMQFSDRFLTIS
jgi:hypothetical protein